MFKLQKLIEKWLMAYKNATKNLKRSISTKKAKDIGLKIYSYHLLEISFNPYVLEAKKFLFF